MIGKFIVGKLLIFVNALQVKPKEKVLSVKLNRELTSPRVKKWQ